MSVLVGTSGFAFKEWKGPFYPKDLKDDAMLGYYSARYPTVEINNTFYRLPREHVLRDWASRVPESFAFSIKATQRITHYARLQADSGGALEFLLRATATLGSRLGPILFQLPANMEKNVDRLRGFLELLPRDRRYTIEFRHESWFDDEIFDTLRARDVALCVAEAPEFRCPMVSTATWGYLRLHRQDYTDAMLAEWQASVTGQSWTDAYVFFKHDYIDGSGPLAVERFAGMIDADSAVRAPNAALAEPSVEQARV